MVSRCRQVAEHESLAQKSGSREMSAKENKLIIDSEYDEISDKSDNIVSEEILDISIGFSDKPTGNTDDM